jgi:hypothetical protein
MKFSSDQSLTYIGRSAHLVEITIGSGVLLEKLTVTQKKLPTFYVTQNIITLLTKVHHWSLS